MKKKLLIAVGVLAVAIIIIGGYAVFNSVFPKANPINIPAKENILSVSLTGNDEDTVAVNNTDFEELLQNISNAQPTRKKSVNDYPTVKSYFVIKIVTSSKEYRYFLYEENSRVYIEIPYEGIYWSGNQMLDFVLKYCPE